MPTLKCNDCEATYEAAADSNPAGLAAPFYCRACAVKRTAARDAAFAARARDQRGDPIVVGSYVRLPNGRHAWVRALTDCVEIEHENGGRGYMRASDLVTTKPTVRAAGKRDRSATMRSAVSERAKHARRAVASPARSES